MMVTGFERIVISVPDLEQATLSYRRLTGLAGVPAVLPGPVDVEWFGLGNTIVELRQSDCEAATLSGLVFSSDDEGAAAGRLANELSLDLRLSLGLELASVAGGALPVGELRVDHLVLRTGSAGDCIALFAQRLGIRLALDRLVPEWGGRMLFFRTGKLTLEVIASEDISRTEFWGIAYQCADIAETRSKLQEREVTVTEIREGRKPGTLVATVKSHCLDIPTLLIGPAT